MKELTVDLPIRVLDHGAGLPLPAYMSAGAAGMDLCAALNDTMDIEPGAIELVPTGLQVAVPQGYELQIRPRSGLAARYGISLVNSPGTIDADYRGEIKVILINLGRAPFTVRRGDRIAQMILCPIPRVKLLPCTALPETRRGEGGFGHTGTSTK
ncbi:MAG TPA: dUTP diphosphatase [Firmicutes bacterium]|nr:dUTP diphosphatase [Bacillota bacterium]